MVFRSHKVPVTCKAHKQNAEHFKFSSKNEFRLVARDKTEILTDLHSLVHKYRYTRSRLGQLLERRRGLASLNIDFTLGEVKLTAGRLASVAINQRLEGQPWLNEVHLGLQWDSCTVG